MTNSRRFRAGLTLIELMVVITLIALIAGISLPRLMPALLYSGHEGAARRLAQYGRAAIAHSAFQHESITVMVDIEKGEYWCEHYPEPEEDGADAEFDADASQDPADVLARAQEQLEEDLTRHLDVYEDDEERDVLDEQSEAMDENFATASERDLVALARRIKHDRRGIFQDVQSVMGSEFDLNRPNKEELEPVELVAPLLPRTRLAEGVFFESILVDGVAPKENLVEIEISPLGLTQEVEFHLLNDDGDSFTVVWDAVTGTTRLYDEERQVL